MSPRRSSRARSSQNPPSATPHTNSSSSVTTTTKDNRATRANNPTTRTASPPRRSSTVRSDSNEDTDSASRNADSTIAPRRSRRGEVEMPEKTKTTVAENEEDEGVEAQEEDITRCICGRPEYPGPGASVKEQVPSAELLSDDIGNFFVQCDKCHVWQHGGCMGLTDESMLPEEYYCEICKPELHKILKAANGAKSSRYLPVLEGAISEGSSPLSSAGDAPRKSGSKTKSQDSTKRRATMNSRGAYDEDEMLRRAIEESKGEMGSLKRSRDELEDPKIDIKRQRTGSSASSSGFAHSQSPEPTIEESTAKPTINGMKNNKLRHSVVKNNKEKELRDRQKEALATQRAEAASKRNARSERRRGEESPPASPALSPAKPTTTLTKPSFTLKEATPPAKLPSNRKGGRPPARRGRLGRNQYTRDLPLNGDVSDSPLRDTSRDPHGMDSPHPHTNGHHKDGINGESGRSSKAKTHPARTSMNEMKRRVAAILEFVGRMRSERSTGTKSSSNSGSGSSSLKGNSTPNGSNLGANLPTASLVKAVVAGLEEANVQKEKAETDTLENPIVKVELMSERTFDGMNSMEMMETLTSELVKWQSVWGTYGR